MIDNIIVFEVSSRFLRISNLYLVASARLYIGPNVGWLVCWSVHSPVHFSWCSRTRMRSEISLGNPIWLCSEQNHC